LATVPFALPGTRSAARRREARRITDDIVGLFESTRLEPPAPIPVLAVRPSLSAESHAGTSITPRPGTNAPTPGRPPPESGGEIDFVLSEPPPDDSSPHAEVQALAADTSSPMKAGRRSTRSRRRLDVARHVRHAVAWVMPHRPGQPGEGHMELTPRQNRFPPADPFHPFLVSHPFPSLSRPILPPSTLS